MNAMDVRPGVLPVDSSLINQDFIRRLQEQRTLHKREVAFHLAEIDKHGAADEALESMIQAAEKIMAIMMPGSMPGGELRVEAATEDVSRVPSWAEAPMAEVGNAKEPPALTTSPTPQSHGNLVSGEHSEASGNSWRARLMRSAG